MFVTRRKAGESVAVGENDVRVNKIDQSQDHVSVAFSVIMRKGDKIELPDGSEFHLVSFGSSRIKMGLRAKELTKISYPEDRTEK